MFYVLSDLDQAPPICYSASDFSRNRKAHVNHTLVDAQALSSKLYVLFESSSVKLHFTKMSDNQWEPVIIKKRVPKGASATSDKVVNAARRQGLEVETVTKCKYFLHIRHRSIMKLCYFELLFIYHWFSRWGSYE